jgi:transcriptional regulator with XRE-family HTH domain
MSTRTAPLSGSGQVHALVSAAGSRSYGRTLPEKLASCKEFLDGPHNSFACTVLPAMGTQQKTRKPRPYKERGDRLRLRKQSLLSAHEMRNDSGQVLTGLVDIAKAVGVSVSGFQQWERGETWPTPKRKAKLARLMQWSEQELDFGSKGAVRQSEMFHPTSPREVEVLALVRALAVDQALYNEALDYLKTKVAALQEIQQRVGGPVRSVSDREMESHLPPLPPPRKPTKPRTR